MTRLIFCISALLFGFNWSSFHAQTGEDLPLILNQNIGESTDFSALTQLNGKVARFSPTWYYEGIAYIGQNSATRKSFYQIWYSPGLQGSNNVPFIIDPPAETDLNYGPLSWSKKNKAVYYTRNKTDNGEVVKDERGRVRLQVYSAKTNAFDDWVDIEPVFSNESSYSNCHPAYWPNEERLIFASDRPDGFGGMDLYEIVRIGGQWSEPVSLGEEINSDGHEIFPFIHYSGHLIFASNREGTEGLDMFLAKYEDGRWKMLGRLPAPFNGEGDDFGLILDDEAKRGVMNSNGSSPKGQDWLYVVESMESLLPIPAEFRILPTIVVIDKLSGKPISNAEVGLFAYEPSLFDDSTGIFISNFESTVSGESEMGVRYTLNKEKATPFLKYTGNGGEAKMENPGGEQYFAYAEHPQYQSSQLLIERDCLVANNQIVLILEPDLRQDISMQFISITGELLYDLDVFLTEQSSSESKYFPIEEDRFLRTQLYEHKDYKMVVIKEGFKTKNFTFNLGKEGVGDDIIVYMEPEEFAVEEDSEEEPLLVLEQILYDYDDSKIKDDYAFELDLLADMLEKFPDITVELSAHTDSRGEDGYNQKLSERRAEAAKEYLLKKGVAAERIVAVGYGETKLRNNCADGVDCTEEEHQYNRRTEVRVISEDN